MNCVYSDVCEEELTCEDEGMADDRCEGMLIWCDSRERRARPTSGAGGCPEFGSQFDNDDSAGGGDDHSGHDHDEGHSSDGATSTTPAVLVAAIAALATPSRRGAQGPVACRIPTSMRSARASTCAPSRA